MCEQNRHVDPGGGATDHITPQTHAYLAIFDRGQIFKVVSAEGGQDELPYPSLTWELWPTKIAYTIDASDFKIRGRFAQSFLAASVGSRAIAVNSSLRSGSYTDT
jgi:hypothetical protein